MARQYGHREDLDGAGQELIDLKRLERWDQEGQRWGFSFLNLLGTTPEAHPSHDNHWKEFVLAMSFSRDLLASVTQAIAHPLMDGLDALYLQGIESLYTELEANSSKSEETEVHTMINLIVSGGLLTHVLTKTSQQIPSQESQPYTNAALLLLTLGLRANIGELRIRMELNQTIHILSVEADVSILDLLLCWLAHGRQGQHNSSTDEPIGLHLSSDPQALGL